MLLLLLLHAAPCLHPAAGSRASSRSSSTAGRGLVSCAHHGRLHRSKVPLLLRRQLVSV
jgi:hypothetical protein